MSVRVVCYESFHVSRQASRVVYKQGRAYGTMEYRIDTQGGAASTMTPERTDSRLFRSHHVAPQASFSGTGSFTLEYAP